MKKLLTVALIIASLVGFTACSGDAAEAAGTVTETPANTPTAEPTIAPTEAPTTAPTDAPPKKSTGLVYLYGEEHGVEAILDKELELWSGYYHNDGMRHLFIEYPYFTGELLNLWMKADNDTILDEIYDDWAGTSAQVPSVKEFFKTIKAGCPETVFHGTDIGHQYANTGERYLQYLRDNKLEDTEQYRLTVESINQAKTFYSYRNFAYRENVMAQNFMREFDTLQNESIMGIYGASHVGIDEMDSTGSVPSMANQLYQNYGKAVNSEDLRPPQAPVVYAEPVRTDTITVNGKDYEATYYGAVDISSFSKAYVTREFWRLEDAYDDFKGSKKTNDVLPHDNYPMLLQIGQVFVIDYTKADGTVDRLYYRSDGDVWQGQFITVEFLP